MPKMSAPSLGYQVIGKTSFLTGKVHGLSSHRRVTLAFFIPDLSSTKRNVDQKRISIAHLAA
jgi:hypothetical protein